MDSVSKDNLNLPILIIYIGILGGFFLTIFQILKIIYPLFFNRAKLDVKLTNEIFFRLTDDGECFFANGVIFSENGTVQIQKVDFFLSKINGSVKHYTFKTLRFGTKIVNPSIATASHNFHTTSPIHFITKNRAYRPLYMCVLEEKASLFKNARDNFRNIIKAYRSELYADTGIQDPEQNNTYLIKIEQKIVEIGNSSANEMIDLIQMEGGEYDLQISVLYKRKDELSKVLRWNKNYAKDSIQFKVADNFREKYKLTLKQLLYTEGYSIMKNNDTPTLVYPEYEPENIKES